MGFKDLLKLSTMARSIFIFIVIFVQYSHGTNRDSVMEMAISKFGLIFYDQPQLTIVSILCGQLELMANFCD